MKTMVLQNFLGQTKYIMGHVKVVNIYKVLLYYIIVIIINPNISNFSSIECKFQLTSLVLSNFVTGRILGQSIGK